MTVGFSATEFTVAEGEQTLSVCADLIGQTAIPLVISVSAQGIVTIIYFRCKKCMMLFMGHNSLPVVNSDFTIQGNPVLVFSPFSSSQECLEIDITQDNFVENNEMFPLTLTTILNAVTLTPATTLITITNDDCELTVTNIIIHICRGAKLYHDNHTFHSLSGCDTIWAIRVCG